MVSVSVCLFPSCSLPPPLSLSLSISLFLCTTASLSLCVFSNFVVQLPWHVLKDKPAFDVIKLSPPLPSIFFLFLTVSLSDVGTECFCTSGCNNTVCTLNTSTSYCYTHVSNSTVEHGCKYVERNTISCLKEDIWLPLLNGFFSRCCTKDFCNQCPEVTTNLCSNIDNSLNIRNQIPNCTMTCLTTTSTQFGEFVHAFKIHTCLWYWISHAWLFSFLFLF